MSLELQKGLTPVLIIEFQCISDVLQFSSSKKVHPLTTSSERSYDQSEGNLPLLGNFFDNSS